MIFKGGSADNHGGRASFLLALRQMGVLAAVGALIVVLVQVIYLRKEIGSPFQNVWPSSGSNWIASSLPPFLMFGFLIFSIVAALVAFGFLHNRNAALSMFSLPVTRSAFFNARFFTGMAVSAVPAVALMLSGMVIRLFTTGVNWETLGCQLYIFAGFLFTALVAYCISVFACLKAGDRLKAGIYSLFIIAMPSLLFFAVFTLLKIYLPGYGHWAAPLFSGGDELELIFLVNPAAFFFMKVQYLNDILVSHPTQIYREILLNSYIIGNIPPGPEYLTLKELLESRNFSFAPGAFIVIAVIAAGIAVLCRQLFMSYRAELATQPEIGRRFGQWLLSLSGFSAICLCLSPMEQAIGFWGFAATSVILRSVLIGLAVAVALFVGGFFLFRLREKNMKRLLPPFLFMLLGPFLLGALFSSGFFGWSYYVPKASQVEEMEISYRGLDGISILHSGNGSWGGNAIYGYENIRQVLLTDPADIEKGLAAHKALSSSRGGRLGGEITVAYKLKNGRTVYRYYKSANVNALKVFLELDNTKEVDAILAYLLTGGKAPRSYTTQNIAVRERGWSATLQPPGNLLDENIPLTLIYPWGQEEAFALNLAQRVQLGETLLRELRAQTLEQRYFPAEQEVVTLRIDRRNNYESFLLNLALSRGQFGETLALLEQWGWLPEWERPEIEFALVDPFSKLLKRGYYSRPPAVLYVNQLIYVALMPGYGESYYNYLFREFQKISDGFEKVNDAAKVRALYESSVTQMHISQPGAAAVWFKIAGEETYFCRYVSGSDLKAILR